jgi:ABC-type phosphate transport system substrate-binding protein
MIRSLAGVLIAAATLARADEPLVVIVNPDSGVTRMTREEAAKIFLGNQKFLAAGLMALPVEPVNPEGNRAQFYQRLVNMSLPQVRTYWTKLFFSGCAQPPHQAKDSDEVLEFVATGKGGVGFIEQSKLNRRVRAVLTLDN